MIFINVLNLRFTNNQLKDFVWQYTKINNGLKWQLLNNKNTIRLLHNAINFLKRYKGVYKNYTEIYDSIVFK